jgi:hypothetical protein
MPSAQASTVPNVSERRVITARRHDVPLCFLPHQAAVPSDRLMMIPLTAPSDQLKTTPAAVLSGRWTMTPAAVLSDRLMMTRAVPRPAPPV